jgi:Tfp pilus assembly protein PilX
MRRRLHAARREDGFALAMVVLLTTVLAILSVTLMALATDETNRSTQNTRREGAYQAAEAGVEDYIAKMVDDRLYYLHNVHPGEATRRDPGGNNVAPGVAWPYGLSWSYPNGKDTWRTLSNGFEYDLQITPPSATDATLRILSTGRRTGSTTEYRVIETKIRPSSLADFYRVVDGNVSWGSGATTNGKIYANGNIDHDGTAAANMYAEGSITGSYTLTNGAQTYNSSTIRTVIKNPINFANFVTSFVDVKSAAQSNSPSMYFNNSSKAAWKITFKNNGTFDIAPCTKTSGKDVADTAPTCTAATNYPVPANGAIYTDQTALVSGVVNGRVTVASTVDIVVGGDISVVSNSDDVLGLAATTDVTVAQYVGSNMSWQCSVLAQTGTWQTYTQDGSHNNMYFRGSSATKNGGSLTMFQTRDYGYQADLQYLPPPWFPTVEDAYTIVLWRELPGS